MDRFRLRAPVLMYHDIVRDESEKQELPVERRHYALTGQSFSEHLKLIRRMDLETLTADDLSDRQDIANRATVLITFDDGHISQYEWGFRLLHEHGLRATFFIVPAWIGRPGFLTWDHVKEMVRYGMSVQSHTYSHQFLVQLMSKQLVDELRGSKKIIEDHTGKPVHALSLPGGRADRAVWQLAASYGYEQVYTSSPGYGEYRPLWERMHRNGYQPRAIHRFAITPGIGVRQLESLLARPWGRTALSLRLRHWMGDAARLLVGSSAYDRLWRFRERILHGPSVFRRLAAAEERR